MNKTKIISWKEVKKMYSGVRKNLVKILMMTKNYGQITRISCNGEIMAVIKPVKSKN